MDTTNPYDQFDPSRPASSNGLAIAVPSGAAQGGNPYDQFDTPAPEGGLGRSLLGVADAGLSGAAQFITGGLAAVARTANRVLPDELFGKENYTPAVEADINRLEQRVALHPQTPEGQRIGDAFSGLVQPIAHGIGNVVGAVVGDKNTPAVMDALATLGVRGSGARVLSSGVGMLGRGSEEATGFSAARTADQAARDAGQGTAGLATGSPTAQAVEKTVGRLWGGGPVADAANAANTRLGTTAGDIIDNLSGGVDTSPQSVGQVLNQQLKAAADNSRQASSEGYSRIGEMIPQDATVPVDSTLGILDKLTNVPGASATSEALVPHDVRAIFKALKEDAGPTGHLPYQTLQQLRSVLGSRIDWSPFGSSPANGTMKLLYKAMSSDLDAGASSFGEDVSQAVRDNNKAYAKAAATRSQLGSVIEKAGGPEKVWESLYRTTDAGSTTIDTVLDNVDAPTRKLLAASVLERMGKATAGAQGAGGAEFSADRFLTNWNKMSPDARQSLFSSLPGDYAKSIDQLVSNTARLKAYGKVLANRSGTANALAHVGGFTAILESLLHFSGHGFAATAGAIGLNRALALALTNPATTKYLARASGDAVTKAVSAVGRAYGQPGPTQPAGPSAVRSNSN